ncbi:MAG: hypothetical protein RIQ52_1589 [Pseudomonadota bacterium]
MMSLHRVLSGVLWGFALAGCHAIVPSTQDYYEQVATGKDYDDVLQEAELAITEENFRMTGHNHIGSVIRKREAVPFPDYDSLQFCNLTLARQMLERSPMVVRWMPCSVSLRMEAGKVYVGTALLPEATGDDVLDEMSRSINGKLRRIVDFAVRP